MRDFMGPDIAALSESLVTDIAGIRFLTGMAPFVGLQIPQL